MPGGVGGRRARALLLPDPLGRVTRPLTRMLHQFPLRRRQGIQGRGHIFTFQAHDSAVSGERGLAR